ncbi:MAG: hypothetical protein KDD40_09215, partial [Bdellovibrionales bacterium]|nr:hypothetical protein [Bdellovibrionales bacterium]
YEAARIYSDALDDYDFNLRNSLYELFNLEEEMLEVEAYIAQSHLSTYILENFQIAKYYVDELLSTYQQNVRDFDHLRDRIVNPDHPDHPGNAGQYMYTDADSLNFRYAPSTDTSDYICGQFPRGTFVKVVGVLKPQQNYYNSNITWAEVEVDETVRKYITNNKCYSGTHTVYLAFSYLKN